MNRHRSEGWADQQLGWGARTLALSGGGLALSLLITAWNLQPDPSGLGTHQQLGLPACSSMVLFGMRCPSCGMTTAWALATRGQIGAALEANAGGLLLAAIALVTIPASCYFFISGRATRGGWFSIAVGSGILLSLLVATLQWIGLP